MLKWLNRDCLRPLLLLFAAGAIGLLAQGCSAPPLLFDVSVDPPSIRPDGSGIAGQARIRYALDRRAQVMISIVAPDGTPHILRDGVLRAPDHYETRFDGSVATGQGSDRRLLSDGVYTVKVSAIDANGRTVEELRSLVIEAADTVPLEIDNLVVQPTTITPNDDADADQMLISYSLSKKAEVTVFVTDAEGRFSLLQPPTEQQGEAGLSPAWDGKENGGRLLANGSYTLHVKAVDKVGNVTEKNKVITLDNGGTPRMVIQKVRFSPPIVPLNGTLRVEITVKNIGETTIRTLGPDPGTTYSLNTNYATFRDDKGVPLYFEQPGRWRVGVMWNNAPQPYPARWGFGKDLEPGEERTVQGEIVIDAQLSRTGTYFWAGIEQGGIGFHDVNRGQTEIRLAY